MKNCAWTNPSVSEGKNSSEGDLLLFWRSFLPLFWRFAAADKPHLNKFSDLFSQDKWTGYVVKSFPLLKMILRKVVGHSYCGNRHSVANLDILWLFATINLFQMLKWSLVTHIPKKLCSLKTGFQRHQDQASLQLIDTEKCLKSSRLSSVVQNGNNFRTCSLPAWARTRNAIEQF